MPEDDLLQPLRLSDQRLVQSVDSLADDQWRAPSLLPGWTRAHVVAHLALNAEGFIRALAGLQAGKEVPVYDSNEVRNADIEEVAALGPAEIRDRVFAAITELRHTFGSLTAEQWQASVNRLPEGPVLPVANVLTARRQEVEIHHADLGLDYSHRDWPADFTVPLLERLARNHGHSEESEDFAVRASDLDRTLPVGGDEPVVSGSAPDLTWWLLGRGTGAGLAVSTDAGPAEGTGALPQLGPWMAPPPPPPA